jgi:hypothetical protein
MEGEESTMKELIIYEIFMGERERIESFDDKKIL